MAQETPVADKIEEHLELRVPNLYKVLLHNDDTTTVDFVIHILMRIFHRTIEDAVDLTQVIHETGIGIAGSPYTKEIAEEKALETIAAARANGYPLIATFEEL